jgi:hypothetical protein
MENNFQLIPFCDIEKMGMAIAGSGLFEIKDKTQAVALMLIAQAEGKHPALAARDYHIIEGRPSKKADTMLSDFQFAGGKMVWIDYTDKKCSATFSHPQSGSVTVEWTIEMAKKADVYKEKTSKGYPGMWVKYPRQMLKARVISEGIRATFPGANSGMYTPEEIEDIAEATKTPQSDIPLADVVGSKPLPIPEKENKPVSTIPTQEAVPKKKEPVKTESIKTTLMVEKIYEKGSLREDHTVRKCNTMLSGGLWYTIWSATDFSKCVPGETITADLETKGNFRDLKNIEVVKVDETPYTQEDMPF